MLEKMIPYLLMMRLHRPIGVVLLLFPCFWGVFYVQKNHFSLKLLGLFFIGALIMRSAGCLLNDLMDEEIDQHVKRTQQRPLVMKTAERLPAFLLFGGLCLLGGGVLVQFPPPCWGIGFMGLALLIIYPLTKRFTYFPQVWLGVTFNLGFPLGVVAATQEISSLWNWPVLLIYGAALLWTVGYDTIYAYQDRLDDISLNVGSTAVLFGDYTRLMILGVYFLSAVFMIIATALSSGSLLTYGFLGGTYLWILYRLWILNIDNPEACQQFFLDNQWVGAGVLLGFLF